MVNIFICDDNLFELNAVARAINMQFIKIGVDVKIETYNSVLLLLKEIEAKRYFDIAFIDIEMPGTNGLELAKQLYSMPDLIINFVTNCEQHATEAFRLHPFSFIRKSALKDDLNFYIPQIIAEMNDDKALNNAELFYEVRGRAFSIRPHKTMYLQVQGKITTISSLSGKIEIFMPLKRILKDLTPYHFFLIQNHMAINPRFIAKLERQFVLLRNDESFPISKHRIQDVRESYSLYANKSNTFQN